MSHRVERRKDEQIESVIALLVERMDRERAEAAARFVRRFYANVPPDDIAQSSSEQLYGAALSAWQLAQHRTPGDARVRVYNPRVETHGWKAARTVVETVNDDMPFLVDSVTAELNRLGLTVHLVVHPVIGAIRDADGALSDVAEGKPAAGTVGESVMHIQISPISDPELLRRTAESLEQVLSDVRAAVADWKAMRAKIREASAETEAARKAVTTDEAAEAEAFLDWLDNDNFTFLGYREYRFCETGGESDEVAMVPDGGLGLLRDDKVTVLDGLRRFATLPPDVQAFLRAPRFLMVTKSNRPSTVHRPVALDVVLVKRFDAEGRIIGERLFVGLFTSIAYSSSPKQIPFLRRKLDDVAARAGFAPGSHDAKALQHILETYPRDELFQIETDELHDIAMGVLHLQERQRLALFVRHDPFERFASCLVYVPRDRYDTALRLRFQTVLETAFQGRIQAFYTQVADGALARLHFIVAAEPGRAASVDVAELEAELAAGARGWGDRLRDALIAAHGEEIGLALFTRYAEAFPAGYRDAFTAEQAVSDIDRIEADHGGDRLGVNLYRPLEAKNGDLNFKIYHSARPVALSDVLPVLEHMDLRVVTEAPFEIRPKDRPKGRDAAVWLHDFAATAQTASAFDDGALKENFQEAFTAVWEGRAEADGFNRLVLRARLTWREAALLRAMAKYLRQARFVFSQDVMETTLAAHPPLARLIVQLFHARFDPAAQDGGATREAALREELARGLDAVENLDEDRVLRRFINLATSILRTNYYQPAADGSLKPYISFKLDSRALDELPAPRPWVEVFVYSPRVEGIHLRGGKVARGGIRWSDRREDFRTEVLGLMKAQMVKNTVIVPVGSKGGFVVKRPPPASAGPAAFRAEGIECYKTLIRGLLDITDNLDGEGRVAPPPAVVRRDLDDPYLVVAADKGTATFSDIANGVSLDYGFWLGDAFASGGSQGYDHKKMGITARGAWECVKRHFREIGIDTQTQDFTVVGVGDMSGDVFGNGMLLSPHIRLLAAFDHRHIFIDPDPDPAAALEERQRLFNLPGSSWGDYDAGKLSAGGRIYPRSAKSLALTPEISACFGLTAAHMTPAELMRALLTAEVDLLWFGGIGAYVKASGETHADAGDKANDAVRVDAAALRCKVVGEGANLGMTQRARIEAGLKGVRLNTDAIDNSAGVDTSDHEVNIKILLDDVLRRGDMTAKQRNQLLAEMTEEVAAQVLADNYLQSQALSVAEASAAARLDSHARLMRALEKEGRLDRAEERLPDDEELAVRAARGRGLTRPELAVVLAYSKIVLFDALVASDLPDDPFMADDLARYFPRPLREGHPEAVLRHRLRREIIATLVANSVVNRAGPTFIKEMTDKTGFGPADIARAYAVVRDVFGMRDLWAAIEALDNRAPAQAQIAMIDAASQLLERATAWFLAVAPHPLDVAAVTAQYRPAVETLAAQLDTVLDSEEAGRLAERAAALEAVGAPAELARRVAALPVLAAGPDLAVIAKGTGRPITQAATLYFALGRRFGLEWLRDRAAGVKTAGHWERQALSAAVDDLFAHQTHITMRVLSDAPEAGGDGAASWPAARAAAATRTEALLAELRAQPTLDLAMLMVANRQLRSLTAV
jgi:glutamate dehydrogenase